MVHLERSKRSWNTNYITHLLFFSFFVFKLASLKHMVYYFVRQFIIHTVSLLSEGKILLLQTW